ncbi:MAG: sigma-70 family RNA polymerase sigma factor [Chloroflexi bacterium]|nr:sigma-70 family RNA polymerase sigma factor [Chloroflexota bacterium]
MSKLIEAKDKYLLEKAREGDAQAFGELVERYQAPVFNLCYRLLGNSGDAEDASQEAFIRAYRKLSTYDSRRKFVNWMLTIASNYCVDKLRKRRLTLVSLDKLPLTDAARDKAAGPERALVLRDRQNEVQELLIQLGPRDRAVIVLKYWSDMSYEEIAAALSISESAVKSRLHRSKKELAVLWSKSNMQLELANRRQDESSAI